MPLTWATVRRPGGDVVVEAITSPDNSAAEWAQLRWSGPGEPIGGAPNRRRLPTDAAKRLRVTAALGRSRGSIDVWVLWASLQVKTRGRLPVGAPRFPPGTADGTDRLGARRYPSLTSSEIDPVNHTLVDNMSAAGKVCVIATLLPRGAGAAVPSGWEIRREAWVHTWRDGHPVTDGPKDWSDGWLDDTSRADALRLTPDAGGRIYDLDAPDIRSGQASYERYLNFQQHARWNGQPCSDDARWHWRCRRHLDEAPEKQIELGPENKPLPT